MWPWYGVCITVCMAILVCLLCQLVHSMSHPYIGQISLEIFLWRLVSVLFDCSGYIVVALQYNYNQSRPCTVVMIIASLHRRVHVQVSSIVAHCLEIVGRCSTQTIVSLQTKHKRTILVIDGCFNYVTSRVEVLQATLEYSIYDFSTTEAWGSIHKSL